MYFVEELAHLWKLENHEPDRLSTSAAIETFESRCGVTLPREVRAFYERFNDVLDGTMDEDLNAFWPLSEIDAVSQYFSSSIPGADELFVFADRSIWVHVYAVRLSAKDPESTQVVWIADEDNVAVIADCFSEFWEAYLASPHRILFP